MGFWTDRRPVEGLHHPDMAVDVGVYWSPDGFTIAFDHKGADFKIQTTAAGIEAIMGVCSEALIRGAVEAAATEEPTAHD